MKSSGLKPLTSPAILVSKLVVSKWVIRPMPDTPSTMFDQTVSWSFPIGVMKPMPVTATRRPLEFELIRAQRTDSAAYGHRQGVLKGGLNFGPHVQTCTQTRTTASGAYRRP